MIGKYKGISKQKHLFKSYYCWECKQVKSCSILSEECCCFCVYEREQEKAKEYNNYQLVYQQKVREKKEHDKQYQLLRNYFGCKQCKSKEIDAYNWYEKNKLVCWACLVKKGKGSSNPISFTEQSKWFKKYWKVDLGEWLENFSQLPINKNCAEQWLKDKKHLDNCQCLEKEVREICLLFTNSLKEIEEKIKECSCEISKKVRVSSDYYAWCEKCEGNIAVASKKRVVKNRNDPRFWGLEVEEKVLCLECIGKFAGEMPVGKRYVFRKYLKRGYV